MLPTHRKEQDTITCVLVGWYLAVKKSKRFTNNTLNPELFEMGFCSKITFPNSQHFKRSQGKVLA